MAKLYFHYSSMNAGKSTALLQANHNYLERGMRTMLFTAQADTRYGERTIASRIGIDADAIPFSESENLLKVIGAAHSKDKLDCVLLDEAQFLTKDQVRQLGEVADGLKVPVLAYGLRTDFQAELFEGSQYLLAWSDDIREIKTICHCGKKATMNARIDGSGRKVLEGEQVEIGGNERYVSLCRRCFNRNETKPA